MKPGVLTMIRIVIYLIAFGYFALLPGEVGHRGVSQSKVQSRADNPFGVVRVISKLLLPWIPN